MAKKKAVRKKATKKKTVSRTKKPEVARLASGKYSFLDQLTNTLIESVTVSTRGEVKLKKLDVKIALEEALEIAATEAAGGERVRLPFLGSLSAKVVEARKARKGINPFTGEETMFKARPASRKPRFTFAKSSKDVIANKKNW